MLEGHAVTEILLNITLSLVATGVWALGAWAYYAKEKGAKTRLAFFALFNAYRRMNASLVLGEETLVARSQGKPESKKERSSVAADLAHLELRLTRDLQALPATWVAEQLPFRSSTGRVWPNELQAVTDRAWAVVEQLASMRRDLEKEAVAPGGLAQRLQACRDDMEGVRALLREQEKTVPAAARALDES